MKFDKIKLVFISSFLISFSYGILLTISLFFTKYLSLPISFSGKIIFMGMFGVFPAIFIIPKSYRFMSNEKIISTGCFIYAIAIFFITNGSVFLYYFAGFLFGFGWGVIYTLGPIIVSRLSDDSDRTKNFSYISAFNMLGAGLSPVLVKYLDTYDFSMYNIYYFAFFLSLLAGFLFLFCGHNDEKENSSFEKKLSNLSFNTVVSTKAIIPMVMVFLGACIFSSMMNFQTLIAGSKNLDFSYFYISYTITVILCRFFLSGIINSFPKEIMIFILLVVMTISMLLMRFVNGNLFYIIPSALLGFSYGLVYPLIQSISIKGAISENERKNNLTVFSLCYFIGVYTFPYFFSIAVLKFGYGFSLVVLMVISLIELSFSFLLLKNSSRNARS